MCTSEFTAGGNPARDYPPVQGGLEILLVASCYGYRNNHRPNGPLGSYADFSVQYSRLELQHDPVMHSWVRNFTLKNG